MSYLIPVLPCSDIKIQTSFYESLGFETKKTYTSPNAYIVLQYQNIILHFYSNKKLLPNENPSMCIIMVDDVIDLCNTFTNNFKKSTGKVPRSGFPKITKIRSLKEDCRFTITDPSGNTIYVCQPINEKDALLRNFENKKFSKDLILTYDLLHSKEDVVVAKTMLNKIIHCKDKLNDTDLARLLLLELAINGLETKNKSILERLINKNDRSLAFWQQVKKEYEQLHIQ